MLTVACWVIAIVGFALVDQGRGWWSFGIGVLLVAAGLSQVLS